jgi:hypothetical protein
VGLALLAFAGSGQLGNFGHVGVDQATFAPGVFFWFFVIGSVTLMMAGGISRRPAPVARPVPAAPGDQDPDSGTGGDPATEDPEEFAEFEEFEGFDADRAVDPTPADLEPEPEPEPEPDREPAPPPPPVKPAPDVEDLEDLMFVDADIETDGSAPPAGSG